MKHTFHIITFFTTLLTSLFTLQSCNEDGVPGTREPRITALDATDISYTSATLHGKIELNSVTSMPHLYFLYGKKEDMEQGFYTQSDAISPINGNVVLPLTNLESSTNYSYILTADNGRVQQQSGTITFSTRMKDVPTIGEVKILSQGPTSLIIGTDITDNGGEEILECGNILKASGSSEEHRYNAMTLPINGGEIKTKITNLNKGTTYQIKAFARNKVGEAMNTPVDVSLGDAFILDVAGRFADLIDEQAYSLPTITICGPMNGIDFKALRKIITQNTGTQHTYDIDITDVNVTSGGDSYYESYFTKDNTITQYLFGGFTTLRSIKLPNEVTTIERDAFKNCSGLTTITIPPSVTNVLPSDGCTALKAINVSPANSNYTSHDGVLFNANGTELLWIPLAKEGAFTIPNTVNTIGKYAFKGCNITRLTLPDNLTNIEQAAFAESKIETLQLPNALKTISTSLLQDCENLKTVHIGNQTELLGNYVFAGCPLTDIYVTAAIPPVCSANTFTSNGKDLRANCTLHVPSKYLQTYMYNKYWREFKDIVAM